MVDSVLDELKSRHADLSEKDLLQGHIQVYSTVDARVQQIANEALEHGLLQYERRHPSARGLIQGSVVVLRNRDASILAETGGRQSYRDRASAYSDFNRVTKSLRQPGSAMKPIVYLAAFRQGTFNLDTAVPDEPISVPNGRGQDAEMDLELRWSIQGHDPHREWHWRNPETPSRFGLRSRSELHSILETARNSGDTDAVAPLRHNGVGGVRGELARAWRMRTARSHRALSPSLT